jgi:hypothetical protein
MMSYEAPYCLLVLFIWIGIIGLDTELDGVSHTNKFLWS